MTEYAHTPPDTCCYKITAQDKSEWSSASQDVLPRSSVRILGAKGYIGERGGAEAMGADEIRG